MATFMLVACLVGLLPDSRQLVVGLALLACAVAAPFTRWRWPLETFAAILTVLIPAAFCNTLPVGAIAVALLFGELRRRAKETAEKDLARQREHFERDAQEQRAHLVREIHDIVTHSLTVIVAQADDARFAATPEAKDEALRTIGNVGRDSLRQMRGVVELLRDAEQRPLEPTTQLDIDGLIATSRAGGLNVAYTAEGTPPEHLAPTTALTAQRIVQESLTNAMKHGTGRDDARGAGDPRARCRFHPGRTGRVTRPLPRRRCAVAGADSSGGVLAVASLHGHPQLRGPHRHRRDGQSHLLRRARIRHARRVVRLGAGALDFGTVLSVILASAALTTAAWAASVAYLRGTDARL